MLRRPLSIIALCVSLVVVGCAEENDSAASGEKDAPPIRLVKEGEDGTRIVVEASPSQPAVAEPIKLTLSVQADAQRNVTIPDPSGQLGEMNVRDAGVEERVIDGANQTVARTVVCDSSRPGALSIGPLTATIDGEELLSEPLTLEVQSTLTEPFDPAAFADIPGPVAIEKPRDWTMTWVVGVVGVLALAALWLLFKRSVRGPVRQFVPPAHVLALRELDALLGLKLIEQGRLQEFYFRLSGLVRAYIEMRFGLMAPERTTQEFLAEAQRSDALRLSHKDLLRGFLVACDMVKYARYEPPGAETEAAIAAARSFIEQTAARETDADGQGRSDAHDAHDGPRDPADHADRIALSHEVVT